MATESTLPLNLLPPEMNFLIFSKLTIKTLILCTQVSKVWKGFIENSEQLWKELCLQKQKRPEDSWFTHFASLRKQVSSVRRALQTVPEREFGHCFVKSLSNGKIGLMKSMNGPAWTLVDMEDEKVLKRITFPEEQSPPLAMDYPYVVTIDEGKFIITDISKLAKVATVEITDWNPKNISIKGKSLAWNNGISALFVRDFTKDTSIKVISFPKSNEEYYRISSSILQDKCLICGLDDGVIKITEMNQYQVYDLDSDKLPKSEVIYFVADGNLLVSYHKCDTSNIRVWDLNTKKLTRIFTDKTLPIYPPVNFFGHLITMNQAKTYIIWDIFTEKLLTLETNDSKKSSYFSTMLFYKHKVFQLNIDLSLRKISY